MLQNKNKLDYNAREDLVFLMSEEGIGRSSSLQDGRSSSQGKPGDFRVGQDKTDMKLRNKEAGKMLSFGACEAPSLWSLVFVAMKKYNNVDSNENEA